MIEVIRVAKTCRMGDRTAICYGLDDIITGIAARRKQVGD
jgi:hypothetical protein